MDAIYIKKEQYKQHLMLHRINSMHQSIVWYCILHNQLFDH